MPRSSNANEDVPQEDGFRSERPEPIAFAGWFDHWMGEALRAGRYGDFARARRVLAAMQEPLTVAEGWPKGHDDNDNDNDNQ